MAKFNTIKNSFLSGELSDKMDGRTDLPQYAQGVKILQNMSVYTQGGSYRRPGSIFYDYCPVVNSTYRKARLFPFVTASSDQYLVVITGTGTTSANWYVKNIGTGEADTSIDRVFSSNYHDEISSYTDDELDQIQFTVNGDLLFLCHPSYPTMVIQRRGQNRFELVAAPEAYSNIATATTLYAQRVPYKPENANGSNTVTWSHATGTGRTLSANHDIFHSGHVGCKLKIRDGATTGWAAITAVTNAREATYSVETGEDLPAAGTSSTFAMQAWNRLDGWPKSIIFFQQRAYWTGPGEDIWLSQLGNYANMSELSATETDPTSFQVASTDTVTEVLWANVVGNDLAIGALSNEFVARPFDQTDSISAANPPTFRPHSHLGSSLVQPIKHDYSLSFVEKTGKKVHTIKYDLNRDAYTPEDLSILADHMVYKRLSEHATYLRPEIIQMVYQSSSQILWCIDNNGGLFACTIDANNQIVAWHNHILGGELSDELCKVVSIANIPSGDSLRDQLWMVVKRTLEPAANQAPFGGVSTTVYTIEYLGNNFDLDDTYNNSTDLEDKPVYMDSAIVAIRAAVSGREVPAISRASADNPVDNGTTNSIITFGAAHGLSVGDAVSYTSNGGTDIAGLVSGNTYYVAAVPSATQIKLGTDEFSRTAFVRMTSDGSGTHTFTHTGVTKTMEVNTSSNYIRFTNQNKYNVFHFNENDAVVYTASGTAIGGLTSGNTYYVRDIDRFNQYFKLSATSGGSVITLSAKAAGTHTFTPVTATATVFPGFGHLNNQTVDVVADGFYVGQQTVSSGSITLDRAATEVIVGLRYESIIKTMRLDPPSQIGSSQGDIKRIDRVVIRFYRTVGAKYGTSEDDDDMDQIIFRPATLAMNEQIPLFTGDKVLDMPGSPDRDQFVYVKQDLPFPMSVTAIMMRGFSHEG